MLKVIALALAVAATSTVAAAQGTTISKSTVKPPTQAGKTMRAHRKVVKSDRQAALRKEAKISEDAARATALKEVPNGTVKSSELERENGKLIYSFDIAAPGKSGVEEVNVDAIDGSVVAKERETAKTEKKEAAKEAKEKKTAAKK